MNHPDTPHHEAFEQKVEDLLSHIDRLVQQLHDVQTLQPPLDKHNAPKKIERICAIVRRMQESFRAWFQELLDALAGVDFSENPPQSTQTLLKNINYVRKALGVDLIYKKSEHETLSVGLCFLQRFGNSRNIIQARSSDRSQTAAYSRKAFPPLKIADADSLK